MRASREKKRCTIRHTHRDRYFRRLSTQCCKKNIVATMCTSFTVTPDNPQFLNPPFPLAVDPHRASDAEADTCTFADRTWCDQIESSTVQLSFIVPSRILDRIGTIGDRYVSISNLLDQGNNSSIVSTFSREYNFSIVLRHNRYSS